MITYGFSIQGKSHIDSGKVCQDSNKVIKLNNEWYMGVVADGVGSAKHSEIGSQIAVEALCQYCGANIETATSDSQLESILCSGYEFAMDEIQKYAMNKHDNIENYDTTLSSVLFDGKKIVYGHAGDGGIIVKKCDGTIYPITKRQKGADGTSVRPLRAGSSSWEFGCSDEDIASVLLVTDGLLDGVFQPSLLNLPPSMEALARGNFAKDNIYITAAEFFMNPVSVYKNKKIPDGDRIIKEYIKGNLEGKHQDLLYACLSNTYSTMFDKKRAGELLDRISQYYYVVWALKKVTDDKSVVCLMNERANVVSRELEYYYEPDWKQRQETYNSILYGRSTSISGNANSKTDTDKIIKKDSNKEVNNHKSDSYKKENHNKNGSSDKENRLFNLNSSSNKSLQKNIIYSLIVVIVFLCGIGSGYAIFGKDSDNQKQTNTYVNAMLQTSIEVMKILQAENLDKSIGAVSTQKPTGSVIDDMYDIDDDYAIEPNISDNKIQEDVEKFFELVINLEEQDINKLKIKELYELIEEYDLYDKLQKVLGEDRIEPEKTAEPATTEKPKSTKRPKPTETPGPTETPKVMETSKPAER